MGLSEDTMEGGRGKENVSEKYWNNALHEYNTMHYTINSWLLGEQGDTERVINKWEGPKFD
jgi:hypothetical protein